MFRQGDGHSTIPRDTIGLLSPPPVELEPTGIRAALGGVSLQVPLGEPVVVLGASGSDKSTLLHAITGIVPHTVTAGFAGEASLGVRTKDTSVVERSRHLGVLAQATCRLPSKFTQASTGTPSRGGAG